MIIDDVKTMIGKTLQLGDKVKQFHASTGLFGELPEFDSMAVIAIISAIETEFGISVGDEEITAETFASIGSLTSFIEGKLARL